MAESPFPIYFCLSISVYSHEHSPLNKSCQMWTPLFSFAKAPDQEPLQPYRVNVVHGLFDVANDIGQPETQQRKADGLAQHFHKPDVFLG